MLFACYAEGTQTRCDASRLAPPQHPTCRELTQQPRKARRLPGAGVQTEAQARLVMKRAEFALSEIPFGRETRPLERGRSSKVRVGKRFPKFIRRHRYLSHRVAELGTRFSKTAEDVRAPRCEHVRQRSRAALPHGLCLPGRRRHPGG